MKSRSEIIVYLDRLSTSSLVFMLPCLLRMCWRSDGVLLIEYFDSSEMGLKWSRVFQKLLPVYFHALDYSFADVRDTEGSCPLLKVLFEHALDVASKFSRECLEDDPFFNAMKRYFGKSRMSIYLRQSAANQVSRTLLKSKVVAWHNLNQPNHDGLDPRFFVERTPSHRFVSAYAGESGVRLEGYLNCPKINIRKIIIFGRHASTICRRLPYLAFQKLLAIFKTTNKINSSQIHGPTVMVPLDGNGVSLDPKDNSDLFWISSSMLDRNQILAYAYRQDFPLDDGIIDSLRMGQIRYVARTQASVASTRAPIWRPSPMVFKVYLNIMSHLIKPGVLSILRSPRIGMWLIPRGLRMIKDYSIWHEFFRTYQVKLFASWPTSAGWRIPAEQALEDLDGISLYYQRSLSILPSANYATSVDVYFAFGEDVKVIHRNSGSHVNQFVTSGYTNDHGFEQIIESASQIRNKLKQNGAEFIICYLDEAPIGDKRYSLMVNEEAASNYKFLLEKALEDPTIGLVFKPKKPSDLWRSLGSVADLLQLAIDSGRCVVFENGSVSSPTLPSEAGLASDVSIGLLIGGAAAFECSLAGIPTVLFDPHSLYNHPLYSLGLGQVVFQNWEELWKSLVEFRKDPFSARNFGNWKPMTDMMDPFNDGKASERIGSYMTSLANALQKGLSRSQALKQAGDGYRAMWGEDRITVRSD